MRTVLAYSVWCVAGIAIGEGVLGWPDLDAAVWLIGICALLVVVHGAIDYTTARTPSTGGAHERAAR